MDLDKKFSLKTEIKNECIEEDLPFSPEFCLDFDYIKKEEIEVSEELDAIDESQTFLNLPQDYNSKIEDLTYEKKELMDQFKENSQSEFPFPLDDGDEGHTLSYLPQNYKPKIEDLTDGKKELMDQFEEIRQSDFPLIFLRKLDINITDKVRITLVDKSNYVIKIYSYNGDEVKIEEGYINKDSLQNLQNYNERCENSSYSAGPITEALESKIPHDKLKVKRKRIKNSKTIKSVRRTGKTLRCRICNYKTKITCNMKRHMGVHVSVSSYNCEECDYITNRRDNLITHILSHSDCKYKCSVCTYKTGDKRCFNRHMLIHSDEKLFKCRFCYFKTNYKDQLKSHELNHSGKKHFMCSECNYKTNYKRNLARHVLNHSGTKALKCHACGYQTNDTGHLKRHKKAFSH